MDPQPDTTPGSVAPLPTIEQGAFAPSAQPAMPQAPIAADAAQAQPVAVPAPVADDAADDLDEEWVRKAKEIVEKTKDDPYLATRELSKIKADYLKTRYNKHIKVDEDNPQ